MLRNTGGSTSRSTSSNQPLVDELTQIARTRLSSADVLRLRDQLTSILESHSGAPASAVTAVRASRGFEAQLKQQKPVSVREMCVALPMWPFQVQAHFEGGSATVLHVALGAEAADAHDAHCEAALARLQASGVGKKRQRSSSAAENS